MARAITGTRRHQKLQLAKCGGGDGFWVQPDGENYEIVYSESQGGHISRKDVKANVWQDIQPKAGEGDPKLRFNWNTPIVKSPMSKKPDTRRKTYLPKLVDEFNRLKENVLY